MESVSPAVKTSGRPPGPSPAAFSRGGNENRGDTKGKDRVYSPLFAKACPSCNYLKAHTRIFAHTLCKDLTGPLIVPWSSEAKFFFFCFLSQRSTTLH